MNIWASILRWMTVSRSGTAATGAAKCGTKQADQFYYRGPGTENYPDMIDRARPFLDEILANEFSKIAIVSHGMIGRVMVGTLLSMSPDEMLSFSQTNDTMIHLTISDGGFLAQHFIGGAGPYSGLPPRSY